MGQDKNKVFKLEGKVQHYDWGGIDFLPNLLDIPNPDKRPFSEYWLGAHEKASSLLTVAPGRKLPLNEFIHADPSGSLGDKLYRTFGRLPYLLKILDVKDMLSIQVHPTKKNAEIEFEKENRRSIPLDSVFRNYKDDNHKPELMVALSDFWLLHGFKPRRSLLHVLESISEFNMLRDVFTNEGYEGLYRCVMDMDQAKVREILKPVLDRALPPYQQNKLEKKDENFWAARAALIFNKPGQIDRGIFSIYFFNLLHLKPGEGIFQAAGVPHAYLEGQNIEIMANSDNVLRAGLTSKHINVQELMKHVRFEETVPAIIHGHSVDANLEIFQTPVPDFALNLIRLDKDDRLHLSSSGVEIFFLLEGKADMYEHVDNKFGRNMGEAFVAIHDAHFDLKALERTLICRASAGPVN